MACSPEQSRINGRKSQGAKTKRGQAISSRNATKHGLLAKKPPLLATEDLESFEGIMEGLIAKYQPQPNDPVHWHLIQTVAMGILKQHRLWQAEAALAYQETTKPPKLKLPYSYLRSVDSDNTDPDSPYNPDNLAQEKNLLSKILAVLAEYSDLDKLRQEFLTPDPEEEDDATELTQEQAEEEIWSSLKDELTIYLQRLKSLPHNPFEKLRDKAIFFSDAEKYCLEHRKLSSELEDSGESSWIALAITMHYVEDREINSTILNWVIEQTVTSLKTSLSKRLDQIEQIERANQSAKQKYQQELQQYNQSIAASKLITPKLELLMRYESHNNKQLMDALAQLEERQQSTKNQ